MSKKVSRNTVDISTKEITSKKARGNKVDFSTIKITSKKVPENDVDFSTIEITSKKVRGNDETTWIFRSAKLHRKSTWKRRGNSSKFGLRRIDITSTSNRRRFDVACPLGCVLQLLVKQAVTS